MKPKRVYMYPAGHAGVALYTYRLANALADQGLHVTLFADDQYELDHLPAKFSKATFLSSKYEGIRANKGTIARVAGIIAAHFYNSHKFYSHVRQDRPEIAHLHSFFFYPIEWYLLNRLKRMRTRIVLTVHTVIPYSFYIRPFPWLEFAILQYLYNTADRVIVHTDINKRQLLSHFSVEPGRVVVIPHGEYSFGDTGQGTRDEEARLRLNIRKNQKVILFFGYIRKIKGIHVLLKAFDLVAQKSQDVVLIIAGSVIERQSFSEYRHIIDRMKHGNRVSCFIDYIEHEDIPLYFTLADVVVLPYTQFSAQSGVLHLAQGFGKPVIVTDVGGLPEAVENHKTGLIVPAGDVECLARAITYLIGNDDLRIEMGNIAKKVAMEKFSWEAIAKATIENVYST